MFDMIRKIWQVGTVTKKQPFEPAPVKYRGKIQLKAIANTNWDECAAACPTRALQVTEDKINLFYGSCIMCGNCARHCKTDAIKQTTDCYLAMYNKDDLCVSVSRSCEEA